MLGRARIHLLERRDRARRPFDGFAIDCSAGGSPEAIVLDCHDRELIAWEATTAGISGEMVRDLMVVAVDRRFATSRAPHRVQWLSDNGSPYAAAKTIDLALALNLEPCFTPVESPESNGMAEAFVRTSSATTSA